MKHIIYFALSFCLFLWVSFISTDEIKHTLHVIHKGISTTEPVACTLVEITNEKALPHEFYMDVESVVCGDNQCKIDVVRIYWDELGHFNKLVLPDDVALEKSEGKSFTNADYKKLHEILKNENSALKNVYKDEIVGTVGSEGVDAMSGETILLEKSAYVKGAVWTCYSLWHWANGDVKQHIRDITGNSYSKSELQSFLQKDNYQLFALEQLIRKKDFSKKTVNAIINAIKTNPELLRTSMRYWNSAPGDIYQYGAQQLLPAVNSTNRVLYLTDILQTEQKLNTAFINATNPLIAKFSYQEIDIFLNILKEKKLTTPNTITQLTVLLRADDFLISRRVYYFLKTQELSADDKLKIEDYYQQWKHKL
ncbi:hypothetical protein MAR621_02721 [Maribacter dokdonensis]|uniref:hypothetical protein n=1 Tax=Maribacter dokdonensis TaxID=320912 RepID=UPI001B0A78B8|nr:hypothetical protein [Maribacter dokdonensis]CAG2532393.1 hypothetical protein MAR621_02721 [Maribacter dokdonensis]